MDEGLCTATRESLTARLSGDFTTVLSLDLLGHKDNRIDWLWILSAQETRRKYCLHGLTSPRKRYYFKRCCEATAVSTIV